MSKIYHWLSRSLHVKVKFLTRVYKALHDLASLFPFGPHLLFLYPSLILFQPHWPPCCSLNTQSILLPSCLSICHPLSWDPLSPDVCMTCILSSFQSFYSNTTFLKITSSSSNHHHPTHQGFSPPPRM